MPDTTLPTELLNGPGLIDQLLKANGQIYLNVCTGHYLPGELLPVSSVAEEWQPQVLARLQEARRLKERLSPLPFYGNRAERWGEFYWVEKAGSYLWAWQPGDPLPDENGH